jgi:heat-inducible transcriptional repressor
MLMNDLDERKQFLLRAIIHDYVATAEPVASQVLVQRYQLHVKSATVRNEMAEMAEMGLLRQPHTSAGRIPSDRGYRFYVDKLMPNVLPTADAEQQITRLRQAIYDEIDEVLRQTCRLLTSLTHYTAVATPPEASSLGLREVHLSPLDGRRCLLVVVPSSGEVKHRIIELGENLSASDLTRISNRLTEQLQGATAEALGALLTLEDENRPEGSFRQLIEVVRDLLLPPSGQEVMVEGTRHMLHQPEFRDVSRLESLLEVLEERRSVLELLRTAVEDRKVQVVIGEENTEEGLRECSLVAARYTAGPNAYGAIGVIGPTRMEYSTAVSTVGLVAEHLSDLFGRWNS